MSQIWRYLPEGELKNIEESPKVAVTTLINETSDERIEEIFKGQWSVREKWIIILSVLLPPIALSNFPFYSNLL